jgi:phosphoribosylaminoimidazolecarboxamide formyltransferase / IMP cyclohydrolase
MPAPATAATTEGRIEIHRALVSVYDKSGLEELVRGLHEAGVELVSTGGSARLIADLGLTVTRLEAHTSFPECLDGRVKTLHPRVHAGILADRRLPEHVEQLRELEVEPFDLVVVNLYPFEQTVAAGAGDDDVIEMIDIGGPTLIRAAAKNHRSVTVLVDPGDYQTMLGELDAGGVSLELRATLASKAFRHTASYDAQIASWFQRDEPFPTQLSIALPRLAELRYGENPHQAAALYAVGGLDLADGPFTGGAGLLQGKPLSYNNILDASAAAALARDLRRHGCVIVKHANPCGAAEADDPLSAWEQALAGDPVSAFGGVVALTSPLTAELAERLAAIFLEVLLVPAYEPEALKVLERRPNLRVLLDPGLAQPATAGHDLRSAGGALLLSEADVAIDDPGAWRVVTRRSPTAGERSALGFAWRVCRHVKSNAIVLAREGAVVGVGAGQMSRVDSARLAVAKAGPERAGGAVCASDAFYPFPDALEVCAEAGVTAFIQPGGSQRDEEVIAAADAAGAAMLFTGVRHFRH